MSRSCVLVIEDEGRYRDLLALNLTRQNYRVLLAPDGLAGLNLLEHEAPDLILLDLMLPDISGYELCRRIREQSGVPIIILTQMGEPADIVRGLGLGADDYITKPFWADELIARVAAVMRRSQPTAEVVTPAPLVNGDLAIDFGQRRVSVGGREVRLSPSEYKLLHQLALHAGRILVQEELLQRVWGRGYGGETELLHSAVRRLRRKIEPDPAEPRYVLTARGVGYWLANPGPD
jgi:DNA-binding response OmpR family regulator